MRSRVSIQLPVIAALLSFVACEHTTPPLGPPHFPSAAVSTAGGRVAFSSTRDGNAEIYVMNPDGSGVTRLTNDPAADEDPAWSPDGSRIAFASTRDGNYELYVMNADGTGVTRLTSDPYRDREPAWCGTRIAFQSDRYLAPFFDIYVMNDDGTGVTRLTISNASSDEDPAWSPSCDRIAYSYDPWGLKAAIWVMHADGSDIHPLVATDSKKYRRPAWSPDGSRIAFASDRDHSGNSFEIYVMNADGTQPTRLTVTSEFHYYDYPAWSSDGATIAFQAYSNSIPGMYVMNADGSGATLLADSVSFSRLAWFGPGAPRATMHVGDLDASASSDRSTWTASVDITVHDAGHNPVGGATVIGAWSFDGSSTSCTTDSVGTCTVASADLHQSVPSVTFTVTAVTLTGMSYNPAANHDVDGSSDGTTVSVIKR